MSTVSDIINENKRLKQEIIDKDNEISNLKLELQRNDVEKIRIETSTLCRSFDSCYCKTCVHNTGIQVYRE